MKEVLAIIRPHKDRDTKKELEKVGCLTCTTLRVKGRGKQRGLRYSADQGKSGAEAVVIRYLPKKMLQVVVRNQQVKAVVQAIIRANKSGHYGDGKIFVSDVAETVRIRTGERGEAAIR
jgi:nitrogen regulatory protein PII 2